MKRALLPTLLLAMSMCMSCSKTETTLPVDFSDLLTNCNNTEAEMSLVPDDSVISATEYEWKISLPENLKTVGNFEDAESMYNTYALMHNVWANVEIWARQILTGNEIDNIEDYVAPIKEKEFSFDSELFDQEAKKFRDNVVVFITNCKVTDDGITFDDPKYSNLPTPEDSYIYLDSILAHRCILSNVDTLLLYNFEERIDTIIAKYKSIQQKVENASDDKKTEIFLSEMQNAKSFDDQCGIVLACCLKNKSFCGEWTVEVLKRLMDSGQYSPLLDRVWIVWRAFSQTEFFGLSRDSYMPNEMYESMRAKVFMTAINHLADKKDDKKDVDTCKAMIANLLGHTCLIRNGSFVMGNDAPIQIMTYCPGFYD